MSQLFGLLFAICWLLPGTIAFALPKRSASEPYAPYSVACPHGQLIRQAGQLSKQEQQYVSSRSRQAEHALTQWLETSLNSSLHRRDPHGWGPHQWGTHKLPRLAIAMSGGGPKAGLTTAGFMQGVDGRDSATGVSGVLQAATYISALSGGSLTLAGVMANNFSRISTLKSSLYDQNYQNTFAAPLNNIQQISNDVASKADADYPATLVDLYGRSISYDFIGGSEGGNNVTWSGILQHSAFTGHEAPFPIITLTDSNVPAGQCIPTPQGPIWEVSPLEFGSSDPTVNAFFPTKYLGTSVVGGKPNGTNTCTAGFDNAGLITGMSSDILVTGYNCSTPTNTTGVHLTGLAGVVQAAFPSAKAELSEYGIIPNPFYESNEAGNISSRPDLYMLDGGTTGQGIPIMPWLQPSRDIDVIIAVDANSDSNNVTDGSSIYDTYVQAQRLGITRMPPVPSTDTFKALNFSMGAHFYGCHNTNFSTVVYIPNTYETEASSDDFFFTPALIDIVFQGGTSMATQGNSTTWPACLACAIIHKNAPRLAQGCSDCLNQYCWAP